MIINEIMIFGANGNMGSKLSAIFSCFGNADVYMVGRSTVSLQNAINDAKSSIRSNCIEKKLHILTYDSCVEKIKTMDMIIETVAENFEVKSKINKLISANVNENAIIASCTSGLSINELAKDFTIDQRKRYLGIHFFNPPYSMTLCEIIPSKSTNKNIVSFVEEYTKNILFRTTIISKDTPAFIANRIGFQFINMCLIYAEKYKDKGGIELIDSIIGPFTGRNMSPLMTADFVGLDVTKSIVDNLYNNSNDFSHNYFILPKFMNGLIDDNKCGNKTNEGLYKISIIDEKKSILVFDISEKRYKLKNNITFDFAKKIVEDMKYGNYNTFKEVLYHHNSFESNLCLELLSQYVIYSIYIGNEIGNNVYYSDDVMATGFNWVPPISLIDALGGKDVFFSMIKEKKYEFLEKVNLDDIKKLCPNKSKYNFRKFMKAKM